LTYMAKYMALTLVVLAAPLVACGGDEADGPRPAGVPESAEQVRSETVLRETDIDGRVRRLFAHDCMADVLTITTTIESVYAELPCDRALPDEVVQGFLGEAVAVTLRPGGDGKLLLTAEDAGSAEYTTGRMWLQRPPGSAENQQSDRPG
jgi:hypothetical protein